MRADRQRAGVNLQQPRRLDRVHLNQSRDIDRAMFLHEQVEEQAELRLQPNNAKWRGIKFYFLFKMSMRGVIGTQDRYRSIGDSFQQRVDMVLRAQRRIDFEIRVEILNRVVG